MGSFCPLPVWYPDGYISVRSAVARRGVVCGVPRFPTPTTAPTEALESVAFQAILQGRGTRALAKRGGVWDPHWHVTGKPGP